MFRICFLSHHHTATPIPSHLHHYHHHLYLPIIFLSNTISPCLPHQQHHNLSSAQSSLFGPSSPLVSTTPMSYSILSINTLSLSSFQIWWGLEMRHDLSEGPSLQVSSLCWVSMAADTFGNLSSLTLELEESIVEQSSSWALLMCHFFSYSLIAQLVKNPLAM